MYRPLAVAMNGAVAPLFANPNHQPLLLAGPLKAAQGGIVERDVRVEYDRGYFDDRLAEIAAESRFQYVIMCGRDRLTRPLPPGVRIAAEKGGLAVRKVDRSPIQMVEMIVVIRKSGGSGK